MAKEIFNQKLKIKYLYDASFDKKNEYWNTKLSDFLARITGTILGVEGIIEINWIGENNFESANDEIAKFKCSISEDCWFFYITNVLKFKFKIIEEKDTTAIESLYNITSNNSNFDDNDSILIDLKTKKQYSKDRKITRNYHNEYGIYSLNLKDENLEIIIHRDKNIGNQEATYIPSCEDEIMNLLLEINSNYSISDIMNLITCRLKNDINYSGFTIIKESKSKNLKEAINCIDGETKVLITNNGKSRKLAAQYINGMLYWVAIDEEKNLGVIVQDNPNILPNTFDDMKEIALDTSQLVKKYNSSKKVSI